MSLRLLVLAALWGASFSLIRVAALELAPSVLVFGRVAVAAVFSCILVRGGWRDLRRVTFIGAMNSALPFVLLAYAAKTLPASTLCVLNASAPAFAALIEALVSRRAPHARVTVGLVLGATGVALSTGTLPQGSKLAIFAALGAALSYGVASVYTRHVPSDADPASLARGSMVAAAVLLFIPALSGSPAIPSVQAALCVLVLGVACTAIAYLLYFRLIRDTGPTGALSVTFLVPIFGITGSALFLGEEVGAHLVYGTGLVLIGTWLTTRKA